MRLTAGAWAAEEIVALATPIGAGADVERYLRFDFAVGRCELQGCYEGEGEGG